MAKNWAIVVGINKYNPNNFARLKYAKRDAELMRDFFREAKFDEVYYFADDSPDLVRPDGAEVPTYPSCGNLLSFLHDRFERPFLSAGDNLWFFFAGHGGRYGDRDYLMPIDANPRGSEPTAAILVSDVRDRLCRCGADNVILILDACRNEGSRSSPGIGAEAQQGVITISACSPTQKSWEIDEIQQGAFTKALLEALQIPGERNCATVERLEQYLRFRVPQLCTQYGKFPEQNPRISVDPATKLHFILLPQYATLTDVAVLKNDAYRSSQIGNNSELAEQLWIRIIAATYGRDMEALEAYRSINQKREGRSSSSQEARSENGESGGRSTPISTPPSPELVRRGQEIDAVLEPPRRSATQFEATIPWALLTASLVFSLPCGFGLAALSTQLLISAAVSTVAFAGCAVKGRNFSSVVIFASGAALSTVLIMAGAASFIWATTIVSVGAFPGSVPLAMASNRLLVSFSKFHTFLILTATACLGLGLGWLVYWVYSLQGA